MLPTFCQKLIILAKLYDFFSFYKEKEEEEIGKEGERSDERRTDRPKCIPQHRRDLVKPLQKTTTPLHLTFV